MVYFTSNNKRVNNKQPLTFRLISQEGKRAEFTLTPEFLESGNPRSIQGTTLVAKVDHNPLPEGVEWVFDNTTIKDVSDANLGIVVRGNMNEAAVSFDGERFPLFKLNDRDVDVQLSVADIQSILNGNPTPNATAQLDKALGRAHSVAGSHGTLYFLGMPVEFGGGLIESYQANPSHCLE